MGAVTGHLGNSRGQRMSALYTRVARFYDAENADKRDDLQLYGELAEAYKGDILDVGCGTGRVLMHLARQGHQVHGIDNDRAMLDRLELNQHQSAQLDGKISAIHADVLEYEYQSRFALILLTYNVLMHFHEQERQIALLGKLRSWLADDGLLVIDLPNAGPAFASQDTEAPTLERTFLDPETGHMIMLQSLSFIDRAEQLLHVEWIYDIIDGDGAVKRLFAPHKLRYFFLAELRLLLERCGLGLAAVYGDTDRGDYTSDSDRMIVFANAV